MLVARKVLSACRRRLRLLGWGLSGLLGGGGIFRRLLFGNLWLRRSLLCLWLSRSLLSFGFLCCRGRGASDWLGLACATRDWSALACAARNRSTCLLYTSDAADE